MCIQERTNWVIEYIMSLNGALKGEEILIMYEDAAKAIPCMSVDDIQSTIAFLRDRGILKYSSPFGRANGTRTRIDLAKLHEYEASKNAPQPSAQPIFHIGNVGNAIIGNQSSAIINVGVSIADVMKLLEAKSASDQAELQPVIDEISKAIQADTPMSKGFLAKCSDVLQKHSDVAIALGSVLLQHLLGQ